MYIEDQDPMDPFAASAVTIFALLSTALPVDIAATLLSDVADQLAWSTHRLPGTYGLFLLRLVTVVVGWPDECACALHIVGLWLISFPFCSALYPFPFRNFAK